MKVIIAGSRDILDKNLVYDCIQKSNIEITEVVCGLATGVDSIGLCYALENNIPAKKFPANWNRYGKQAGILRNIEMGNYADALIAVTNGSKGTAHMISYMKKLGKEVIIYEINKS